MREKLLLTTKSVMRVLTFSQRVHIHTQWRGMLSSSFSDAAGQVESHQPIRKSADHAKLFKDIPGPLRVPVWGNLLMYKLGKYNHEKYHNVLHQLHKTYGPLVREDLGPNNTIIHAFSPDDARTVYATESRTPIIHPLQEAVQIYRKSTDLSLGLGNTNGEEWYRLRSAVRHLMLQPRSVSQYVPEVDAAAKLLIHRIMHRRNTEGEVPTLNEDISKWSQESAGRICFGRSLACLEDGLEEREMDSIISCNREMFRMTSNLMFSLPVYKYIPTLSWMRLKRAEDVIVRYAENRANCTINEIKDIIQRGGDIPDHLSFMGHLLGSKDLTHKDIIIITLSLFLDGLSTTVPTILFNLYNLAKNPEVQERAYDEIKSALCDPDEPITFNVLGNLPYIKAIVKESFRILPNGTNISRVLEKDHILSGYYIPAGTHVHLNMSVNFQSEKYFSEPTKFKPERWLRGGESESIHPFILTPFGHGTRTCAGRRFAEQDLYVLLARIIRKFKMTYPEGEELRTVHHTLLYPDGPVRVRFTPR